MSPNARAPTRNELYYVFWGTAGLALLFAGVVVIAHGSTGLLSLALAVSAMAAFSGSYTFAVTRSLSKFGSRLALGSLVVGLVSVALLPLIRLDRYVSIAVSYSLFVIGTMGFVYIVFVEIPITMPKKPGFSQRGRLLDVGILLMILGSWIDLSSGFLRIPREFYASFFSPLGLTGKVSWITGIVLFSLAVLRARKRHIPEGNGEPLRPNDKLTDRDGQSKS